MLKYLLSNNLVSHESVENKISDLCTSFLFHSNDIINLITAGNVSIKFRVTFGIMMNIRLRSVLSICTRVQYNNSIYRFTGAYFSFER